MAEPTVTLQTLRRSICRELQMPFFRRFSAGFADADSGSTTTLVDATLTQPDNFWIRNWLYRVSSQEAAMVMRFSNKDHQLTLESPVTTIAAGDDYELHSLWNAYEIHEAINTAIRNVRRVFRDVVVDETLIVQEDVRNYDLTALAKAPYLVHKLWIEQPQTVKRGTVVSATASTLTVETSGILSGVDTNWKISIYGGTGKGQLRSIVSVSGAQITGLSSNWTTTPDATSKYALWDASKQTYGWYPYHSVHLSSKEYPDTLYFDHRPVQFWGMRLRLQYSAVATELSAETDTTVVPQEYIKHAAMSILHSQKIGDNRADRDLHFSEWKRLSDWVQQYLALNTPHMPDTMIEENPESLFQPAADDPLNWNRD